MNLSWNLIMWKLRGGYWLSCTHFASFREELDREPRNCDTQFRVQFLSSNFYLRFMNQNPLPLLHWNGNFNTLPKILQLLTIASTLCLLSSCMKPDCSGTYADNLYSAVILAGPSHPGERNSPKVMCIFASGFLVGMSYFDFPIHLSLRFKCHSSSKKKHSHGSSLSKNFNFSPIFKVPLSGVFLEFFQ